MGFFKRLFKRLFGGKDKDETVSQQQEKNLTDANARIQELERELALLNQKYEPDKEEKLNRQKEKLESLLAEANSQIKDLEKKLEDSLNGKIDDTVKAQLAQVEKLKKKIKDLESDLEDAQDDADDYKKKWRNTQTEAEGLQGEVSKLSSSNKELTNELDRAKEELNERKKDLELKVKSLSFVQEVLKAPRTNTDDLVKLQDKVDDITDYILNDFYDCVKALFNPNDSWNDIFDGWLFYWDAVARKRWIQGKTTIAFVGEFSAGKTSIVNRVLSQDQPDVALLPTSAKATTAIPTYITGGPGNSYHFVSADNTLKTIRESTFKEVSKDILGQIEGVSSLIKYFVMQYKNPYLDNISILDTPGFNSNDPEDAERTISVINECDALFWVVDVNAGTVNRSSLQLIHQHLQKPLYVVINQIDTKSNSDVDKVEKLVRKHFEDEGISVNGFVRFSKKEPLKIIMDAIRSVPQNTNDDYLEYLTNVFIPDLLNVYKNAVKKSDSEYQKAENKARSINDKFYKIARTTQDRCNTAQNIPHWETHFLSKDRYEMSQSEGNQLINLLNQIAGNDINNMWEAFNNSYDAAQNVQQAYANMSENKYNYQRIDECANQLKKRIKEYNQLIGKR